MGTGNLDGVDTTHISDSDGGSGGATYPAAGDTLNFTSLSGGGTVTFTASASFAAITSGAYTGTINTNGQTLTVGGTFDLSGTGTRSIILGASSISCGAWAASNTTNLTFSGASSTITTTSSGGFNGGGLTYGTLNMGSFTGQNFIVGANTFATLTFTGGTVKTTSLQLRADQVVTGTFTANGNSATNRALISSDTKGTQRTITAATVSVTNADFQDIVGAGAGSWDLSAITGGGGDAGGNSGITFTTQQTNYWVGGTGSRSDVTHWASSSGGAGSSGRVPLIQDTARIDGSSGTGTITQDMPRIGATDFTGSSGITWTTSTAASFFGSINLTGLSTLTGSSQTYTYEGRGSSTLTSAGKSWAKIWTIDCVGGTLTLGDAFSTSNGVDHRTGTLTTSGYNMTSLYFQSSTTSTRAFNMGATTYTITGDNNNWNAGSSGLSLSSGTSTIRLTGAYTANHTFVGAGLTYYRLENATTGAFALQFTGSNSFNTIYVDASVADRILSFTAGTTTSFTGTGLDRDAGSNIVTINSVTAATHTLSKASGIVSLHDMTITNSIATQANTFYAGATPPSTDGGGNTNWVFSAAPAGGSGALTLLGVG